MTTDRTSLMMALAIVNIVELTFTNKPVISIPGLKVIASKNSAKHKIRIFFMIIIEFLDF